MKAPGYSVKNTIKFFRKHGLPEAKDFLVSSLDRLWVHFHPKHKYIGAGHEDKPTKKVTPRDKKKRSKVEHGSLAGTDSDHRAL